MSNRIPFAVTASLVLFALAGCAGTPAATESPEITPEATVAAAERSGATLDFTCEGLLPEATLAADPHGWTPDASYEPAAGSLAEVAVAIGGIACGYTGSAGEKLAVSFAGPSEPTVLSLIEEISNTDQSTGELGDYTAFFGNGVVNVLFYGYWATLSSPAFTSPADAQSLVAMIRQATPKS